MDEYVIESDTIALRKTTVNDIEFVISAERNSENAQYVGQWSDSEHLESLNDNNILHLIVETGGRKRIGYIIIAGIMNANKSIEFRRIVIVDKGKGYGKETLRLVKELVFKKLKAHRLWLDVREKNARAQHVYRLLGFVEEGRLRESVLVNGKYESLIVMSMLDTEYFDRD